MVPEAARRRRRHSFAAMYLNPGGNLRDLRNAVGHQDPLTPRRYDRARNSMDRSPGTRSPRTWAPQPVGRLGVLTGEVG